MTSWCYGRLEATPTPHTVIRKNPPLSSLPTTFETHFNTRLQELSTSTVLVWSQSFWPRLVGTSITVTVAQKSRAPPQHQLTYGLTFLILFCFPLLIIPKVRMDNTFKLTLCAYLYFMFYLFCGIILNGCLVGAFFSLCKGSLYIKGTFIYLVTMSWQQSGCFSIGVEHFFNSNSGLMLLWLRNFINFSTTAQGHLVIPLISSTHIYFVLFLYLIGCRLRQ